MITKRDKKALNYIYNNQGCTTSELVDKNIYTSLRVAQRRLSVLIDHKVVKRQRYTVSCEYTYRITRTEMTKIKRYNINLKKITDNPTIKNNKFKTEQDLQNYLMHNIEKIEKGLKVVDTEYEIKDAVIDILAIDKNGKMCIIELKNTGDDQRVIFQCIHYPECFEVKPRVITVAPYYTDAILTTLKQLNVTTKIYNIFDNKNVVVSEI